jgi:hypothetical protein
MGCEIVRVYKDHGISGAIGSSGMPLSASSTW